MLDLYVHGSLSRQVMGPSKVAKQACLKMKRGGYDVSIAFDNCMGGLDDLEHAELRVFDGPSIHNDVTYLFDEFVEEGANFIEGTVDNLVGVLAKIDEMER